MLETSSVLGPLGAAAIAREAHDGQLDRDGQFHIHHVARVVEMVPEDCKRVAWLHDVVEDSEISISDLIVRGLPEPEADAVAMLTWLHEIPYDSYVGLIADSCVCVPHGMARTVKEADLLDNLRRSLISRDVSAVKRYRKALRTIQGAMLDADR